MPTNERELKKIVLTFDVDMADYTTGENIDEMERMFPVIQKSLEELPDIKTTWFLRIDSQMEDVYGASDYVFTKHRTKIEWLKENGHEIGWHHHAYKKDGDRWVQDTDDEKISNDLKKYGALAERHGIISARMGWGFQTNATMKVLDECGFAIDSSAVPRPQYRWEMSRKNWENTGQAPYHPSVDDYRIPGEPHLKILEAPINTISIPLPSDTEPNVKRYINPAYKNAVFEEAAERFLENHDLLVLVCHPYEIAPRKTSHAILSFDHDEFENNLRFLRRSTVLKDAVDLK